MFSWLSLIMGLLRFVELIHNWARERQLIKQGEDQAIARATARILERTEEGKRIREKVNSLSDDEESKLWDALVDDERNEK